MKTEHSPLNETIEQHMQEAGTYYYSIGFRSLSATRAHIYKTVKAQGNKMAVHTIWERKSQRLKVTVSVR